MISRAGESRGLVAGGDLAGLGWPRRGKVMGLPPLPLGLSSVRVSRPGLPGLVPPRALWRSRGTSRVVALLNAYGLLDLGLELRDFRVPAAREQRLVVAQTMAAGAG